MEHQRCALTRGTLQRCAARHPAWRGLGGLAALIALSAASAVLAQATMVEAPKARAVSVEDTAGDNAVVEAREALRRGDLGRLAALRDQLVATQHPLARWADHWELGARMDKAEPGEVERFFARWRGSYVEDRLRNDWLLELGRRADWSTFADVVPHFRMDDDREVSCWREMLALPQPAPGRAAPASALQAWQAARHHGPGCDMLGERMRAAGLLEDEQVLLRVRRLTELGQERPARRTAELLGDEAAAALAAAWDNPARFLVRPIRAPRVLQGPLRALAIMRMAVADPAVAATQLQAAEWARTLSVEWAAAAWGAIAREAVLDQLPDAAAYGQRALMWHARVSHERGLSDDALKWITRGQLRATPQDSAAWEQVLTAIQALSSEERSESPWVYWRARALSETAPAGAAGQARRDAAQLLFQRIANPWDYHGQLALEALGRPQQIAEEEPALPLSASYVVSQHQGLARALHLLRLGLRSEGVREWNFSLIGMSRDELRAAARLACRHAVWDRCISAAERAHPHAGAAHRFPLAFQEDIRRAAAAAQLPAAWVMGLIRQESRFVSDARSHVGASGLMQVMPATARWTAKRIGLTLPDDWRQNPDINLQLGTGYLRVVLDDFEGSLPLALAAYNAGPGRARRWREKATLEPAIFIESIPIHETRGYVQNVLANATVYAHRLGSAPAPTLRALMGAPIGPRRPDAPANDPNLP
jgi:soluble lytic murein transglycosylase